MRFKIAHAPWSTLFIKGIQLDPINEKEMEFFASKMLQESIISADPEVMLKRKAIFFSPNKMLNRLF